MNQSHTYRGWDCSMHGWDVCSHIIILSFLGNKRYLLTKYTTYLIQCGFKIGVAWKTLRYVDVKQIIFMFFSFYQSYICNETLHYQNPWRRIIKNYIENWNSLGSLKYLSKNEHIYENIDFMVASFVWADLSIHFDILKFYGTYVNP